METNGNNLNPQLNITNKKEIKGILPKIRQKLLKAFTPIVAVGSILINADKIAAKPQVEPKKPLRTLDNLKKEEISPVESPLSIALRRQLIKQVAEGKPVNDVLSPYLKRLKDQKTASSETIHLLRILGWSLTNEDTNNMGFSIVNEKLVLFNAKEISHINSEQITPLIIEKLGSDNEEVRQAAFLQLVGLTAFSDKKENILSELKKIAQDEKNLLRKTEAQKIINLFDKPKEENKIAAEDKTVEEKQEIAKDEVKEKQNSEIDKWIKIANDKESKIRWEAIKELIKLGDEQAISAIAELAASENWLIEGLKQIRSMANFNEDSAKQAKIAEKALIAGIGLLLQTDLNKAISTLEHYPLYRAGGFSQYIPDFINLYFSETDFLQKDFIEQILSEMPEEERRIAFGQAFAYLGSNNPKQKADAMNLSTGLAANKNEREQIGIWNHNEAFRTLGNPVINLDANTKRKMIYHLSTNDPNSKDLFEIYKTDPDPQVRIASLNGLAAMGETDNAVNSAFGDNEPKVRQEGLSITAQKAYKLPVDDPKRQKAVDKIYNTLLSDSNDETKAYAVSMLSFLELPAYQGLNDKSAIVRQKVIYNLDIRLRQGDQEAKRLLAQIAETDEDELNKVIAKEILERHEEWEKRKRGKE